MGSTGVIRNYKDTIFRMVFREPEQLLELFNAINYSEYTRPDELEIVTLENAIYMNMKNDVSCLLDMHLELYEQQASVNPNMPLRNLMYVTRQYERIISSRDIYSRRLLKLPTPKFIVFYNGLEKQPERREYRLSDAFEVKDGKVSLELVVTQININQGCNPEFLEKCPTLWEYMRYVDKVRANQKCMPLEQAVAHAVDECIAENVLREFLLKNKSEVISMSIFEYDEELHKKTLHDEGYDDGYSDGVDYGLKQGLGKGIQRGKVSLLLEDGYSIEDIAARLQMTESEVRDIVEQLCISGEVTPKI